MKKLISILMLLSILLSFCACGGGGQDATSQPTEEATEPTKDSLELDFSPEALYGHIDQTKPNGDGVYKIWNDVGVKNMVNVPDGTFELLCNVDMQGATLQPIGSASTPFTGTIKGANFIISNFTISQSSEGAIGFVAVNKGVIQDVQLENVTVTADASAKKIGTLAGVNEGTITRCKSTGTLTVESAAADAACGSAIGSNTGDFTNSVITVDVKFASQDAAAVGGLLGQTAGGKMEYVESYGAITVTGENKTVGLFAGAMENTPVTSCAFVGADNSLNGELFTALTGTGDQSIVTGCVMRDNTPVEMTENQRKLRETVVQRMYEICTTQWRVRESLPHDNGIFNKEYTYFGMTYKHVAGTLSRLQSLIDEEGYLKDIVYDMDVKLLQSYMGTDCSTAVINALWTVSNSVDFGHCSRQYPWDETGGCLYVGDWVPDESLSITDSSLHIKANDEQTIYESYAQMKMGDFYVYHIINVGGHTRMAAENAVVVRDQNGRIDPNYSYVVSHEQGWTTDDTEKKTYTSCRAGHRYTFANLIYDGALPVTCEELVTGEMEPATVEFTGGLEGKMGLISGKVKTNYYLDYVTMVITDSQGNEVFNHMMFPGSAKDGDTSSAMSRFYQDSFDMARFVTPLSTLQLEKGESYTYTISATNIPGDTFVVKEGSFTEGVA